MDVSQSLEVLARQIDGFRGDPARQEDLLTFLDERSKHYQGRGAQDTDRLRGYALAAIAKAGVAGKAQEVIIETLETGYNPYAVAGAARAAATLRMPPKDMSNLLLEAATRLRASDIKIWFDTISQAPRPEISRTALTEIFEAVVAIGAFSEGTLESLKNWQESYGHFLAPAPLRALEDAISQFTIALETTPSCCGCQPESAMPEIMPEAERPCPDIPQSVWSIQSENQAGRPAALGDFCHGKPTVLAFFYTRCLNPEKCSRTLSGLGEVQRLAAKDGLASAFNIIAMSYDPGWDNPKRLKTYGDDRDFAFGENSHLIRSLEKWEDILAGFDLSVGYGPATVNRHQIDLFTLDPEGRAIKRWPQRKWAAQEVYKALLSVCALV